MKEAFAGRASFSVEVSGWDIDTRFFVEKTRIERDEAFCLHVTLRAVLGKGTVVHLRADDKGSTTGVIPIAYRVVQVLPGNREGHFDVELEQIRPRPQTPASGR